MHIRSIFAIARKDGLDILLNKTTLFTLLSPIFIAVLFALVSGLLGSKTNAILVYNPGNSPVEQTVSGFFAHATVTYVHSPDEVAAAFGQDGVHKSSQYTAGLVVPQGFDGSLRSRQHPQLNLYVNGDDVPNADKQVLTQLLTDYAGIVANPVPAAKLGVTTINPPSTSVIGDLTNSYIATALLSSFLVGTSLIPSLLVEEKEKKTLRMLMVSPASFADVVMGKLLIVLIYQLVLSVVAVAVLRGFFGNVPLEILFIVLGSCFALALGLVAGSFLQSTGAVGGLVGVLSLAFFLPAIFAGPLGTILGDSPVIKVIKVIPTYYIADGVVKALQNQGFIGSVLLDLTVTGGCALVLLVVAVWLLRRQAVVAATI